MPDGEIRIQVFYVKPEEVASKLAALLDEINAGPPSGESVADWAKRMRDRLVAIHPYHDGNGRLGRILEDHLNDLYGPKIGTIPGLPSSSDDCVCMTFEVQKPGSKPKLLPKKPKRPRFWKRPPVSLVTAGGSVAGAVTFCGSDGVRERGSWLRESLLLTSMQTSMTVKSSKLTQKIGVLI